MKDKYNKFTQNFGYELLERKVMMRNPIFLIAAMSCFSLFSVSAHAWSSDCEAKFEALLNEGEATGIAEGQRTQLSIMAGALNSVHQFPDPDTQNALNSLTNQINQHIQNLKDQGNAFRAAGCEG